MNRILLNGSWQERAISILTSIMLLPIFGSFCWIIFTVSPSPAPSPLTLDYCIMKLVALLFSEGVIAITLFLAGMLMWGLFKPTWVSMLFYKFTRIMPILLGVILLVPPLFLLGITIYEFSKKLA